MKSLVEAKQKYVDIIRGYNLYNVKLIQTKNDSERSSAKTLIVKFETTK